MALNSQSAMQSRQNDHYEVSLELCQTESQSVHMKRGEAMPTLVKFMLRHALIGYAVAVVFVGAILALDVGGLATLVMTSSFGLLAVALLTFFTGLTFASLQMGMAVMSLKSEDEDQDGGGEAGGADSAWDVQPAPVRVHKRR
jgi:hypothetical protein